MAMVRVVPDVSGLDKPFDYAVPPELRAIRPGTVVRVPLHGRTVSGWVVADGIEPEGGLELKAVAAVAGLGPPPEVVDLTAWVAWRWAGPRRALLRAASPPRRLSALPVPPAPGPLPAVPPGPLARAAEAALAQPGRPGLLVPGPATDPLDAVLAACARAGGAVVVLVPSVGWAERLRARLARRGLAVAGSWAEAAAGWPVVVGTRSGAFAPVSRLGAAVVLDAHDEAYREQRSPQFDAATVLAERCRRAGAPCLLVSATPDLAQLVAARRVEVPRELVRRGWPAVRVVDRRLADPRTGRYSEELVRVARAEHPHPVVVVHHRRGRGRLLACAHCGELARCERCGHSVGEVGEDGARLGCATCSLERPRLCLACGNLRLKVLRVGVSRVREELAALLGREVGEVTAEHEELPATPVMVGTEAVLHRLRRASVVAFVDFDLHLLAPRLAAGEHSLALLARAGRLVGGRGSPGAGVVLVQTRLPDHEVLAAAVAGDPDVFLRPELELRRQLALPPFGALAELHGPGAAEYAAALGLDGAPLDADRWLVRASGHRELCDRLAARPRGPAVRVVVDPASV